MTHSCSSQDTARVLLMVCVWGILTMDTAQFPLPEGFRYMLYPVSVMGPFGPQTVLFPMSAAQTNTQIQKNPPANHTEVRSQGLSGPAPVSASGPAPSPAPVINAGPPESSVLQGQMSNLLPSNVPLQVYSFVQQAVIAESGSSEEGAATQVIYMVPISVDSANMGVMEGTVPNPDPGHLQVGASTSAAPTAAPPHAQGQMGKTVATETAIKTETLGNKTL
ncbi:uncharacterized protein LOC100149596 precursor [Danio rerio]|uniref:Uncharacterized protein LOC100149596 precursor n=1 Tax=Danio rerio TaxID=7955 RepID=A0AB13A8I4_DANRE|nr:uncharacterized protein LOC100149596 precursor [Danio rerio]|eukprot:XP_001923050.2 uncharacterized protein si:ch211-149b19.4 isoform X1 [Danio rerio]